LWILVDSNNVIQHAQDVQPTTVPTGQTAVQISDTLTNAQYLYSNPTAYEYVNGQIIQRPYFSLAYSNNIVTATLELPPSTAPTSVTFAVAGQQYTANLANGAATLSLAVHSSLASQQVIVTCSATGCVSGSINLTGGTQQSIGVQIYTPSGGILTVAPVGSGSIEYLTKYYASLADPVALATNTGYAVELLYDVVFNTLLPALQKSTYTPVSLDVNQSNALADVQKNVLPYLYLSLEKVYPSGGSPMPQYQNMAGGFQLAQQQMAQFIAAVTSIPGVE